MPSSPIRKLVPYAEEAISKGRRIYHLNIGQPDIPTPPTALKAVKDNILRVIEYSHSAGIESYRRGLAKHYQNLGLNIQYNQINVTTGGSEALTFAFMACFDEGDELLSTEPLYANYISFATQAGVKIVPVTSIIENDFALPPISEFESKITPKTKGIIICNPNNPTGYLYSDEEFMQIAALVKKYDLFLFSDEVYREFCYDGHHHTSALSLEGLDQNVVVVDSVSKRYSMCGVRIGCIISRNSDIISTTLKFNQARLSPPSYGQIAAEAALNTPREYFEEVYSEYTKRRNFIVDALNSMEGVYCPKPKGAFYATVKLPVDDSDRFAQWILESFHYKNQTVMFAPASGFYSTPGLGKNQVRIAYVLNIDDLRNAMEVLEEALKQYPGRIV